MDLTGCWMQRLSQNDFGGNMFFEKRIDLNYRNRDFNRVQRPVRQNKRGCEFFYSWTGKRNGVQVFGNDLLEYKLNNRS